MVDATAASGRAMAAVIKVKFVGEQGVGLMARGAPPAFVLLNAGPEWRRRSEVKALADQTFRLLGRTGLGHGDIAPSKIVGVEIPHGGSRQLRRGHGNKGETARATGGRIEHQFDFRDGSRLRKQKPQIFFADAGRKVSDVEPGVHSSISRRCCCRGRS